jgi:hypothetical protein
MTRPRLKLGGTVTQATSKSTAVQIDRMCGQITTHNAALAATTSVSFTVTNSEVDADDLVVLNIQSGGTASSYSVATGAVAAGSFTVHLRNISAGSLGEALVINFGIIKATIGA